MKKKYLFLLSLSALSLMACGGKTTSSTAATSSTAPISETSSVQTSSVASSEAASSSEEVSSAPEVTAYTATFTHDDTVAVYVYPCADYTQEATLSDTAKAVDSETGAILSDGSGQINFKVVLSENYVIDAITVTGTYKNLKGPEDTAAENTYRITKIESDLAVNITTRLSTDVATGYKVTFNCDDHVKVYAYDTQDMSGEGALATYAYSRDSDSGELLKDGNGQVNFKLAIDDGYTAAVTIAESTYKNLKGPDDTGVANGYRITKITGDLTVTITTTANA